MFILKRFFSILLFSTLVLSSFVYAQDNTSSAQESETSIFLEEESGNDAVVTDVIQNASGLGIFVRMIVVLALVIVIICAIFAFMRKTMTASNDDDPFLRKVSSVSLSPGRSVQVVTLLDKAYLVGVSENAVNLIGEVTDKELVDAMNVYADKTSKMRKPRNFNEVLSLFMPNGFRMKSTAKEESSVYGDLGSETQDMLKRRYEKLRGEDGGDVQK